MPLPEGALPYHGTLEPPTTIEGLELPPGEDHWPLLGQDKPDWLVEFEEEQARKRR